ncbi:unnamed protein product [Mytilus coruscus]|uniref:Uncharacterized protein n=1 Tax=Mytilus coruscus TaxID=42192 RepID=A0A6J8DES5_MYTCO|nr:unnamed protein product [Mytilus coruscus]
MKNICRNNTVQNWNLLHRNVLRILFTNETGLTLRVKSMGWKVLPVPKVASTTNVPVLKDMFYSSFKAEDSTFYAYANGDNLFTVDLIKTLKTILKSKLSNSDDLLLIGRRTDVRNVTKEEARNHNTLKYAAYYRGSLHSHYAIDFLIIKKSYPLFDLPDLVIGRPYVDSFIVSEAVNRVPGHVIDITMTSLAVHQVTLPGKKGIDEGSTHPDKNYNYDLLKSRNPNYSRGNTNCAHYYTYHTLFDKEITIAIKRRRQYKDKRCLKLKHQRKIIGNKKYLSSFGSCGVVVLIISIQCWSYCRCCSNEHILKLPIRLWKTCFFILNILSESEILLKTSHSYGVKKDYFTNDIEMHLIQTLLRRTIHFQEQDDIQVVPKTKHLLTIITTWVSDKRKNICRNDTVQNWNLLQENVVTISFINESDLTRIVNSKKMGWKVLLVPKVASITNVPVLKDMFYSSFKAEDSTFYAYANGDNLFTDDLIKNIENYFEIEANSDDLLLIGRRTYVRNDTNEEARNHMTLKYATYNKGSFDSHYAVDFFIIKKSYPLSDLPDLVIGRPYVDSFIVSEAVNRVPGHVIDITMTSLAVHHVTVPGKEAMNEGTMHIY